MRTGLNGPYASRTYSVSNERFYVPFYRRAFVPGGTYFFTLVTEQRNRIFEFELARKILSSKIRDCQAKWPFTIDAIVLLPDHLHAILTLPPDDDRYPTRLGWIKKEFTKEWMMQGGLECPRSKSRISNRRRGVWQRKYWEHVIADESDYENHVDYLHYNPVKHGYVADPALWQFSSIHRFIEEGLIPKGWGTQADFAKHFISAIHAGCEVD